jgi:hypothetical protein
MITLRNQTVTSALNPQKANAKGDPDRDHLRNLAEYRNSADPQDEDTDNDSDNDQCDDDDQGENGDSYSATDSFDAAGNVMMITF